MHTTGRQQPAEMDRPLLEATELQKVYNTDAGQIRAVENISLRVHRGEVVGLLGPNGAGKTTLIKCCLGLVSPTAGRVRVDGTDPFDSPSAASRSVAAVLEGARNVYWRLTVRENLRFFFGLQGRSPTDVDDQCDRVLERVGLRAQADEVARTLSRGMKQRLSLACALVRDTPLLFLDEPTLGLDVEAKTALKDEIARLADEQRGVVVCSHDMGTVRDVCDRVVILDDGRVVGSDEVDALLDAFTKTAYRISFAEGGDADSAVETFDTEWDGDRVTVTLPDNEALYELMDRLRASGAVIEAVETVQPDLAEIFVQITSNDSEAPDTRASHTPAGVTDR